MTQRSDAPERRLEYWYDFASTYSYLSAMRIEAMAREAGVGIVWRPFLLGPIFRAQGWDSSPFNLFPAKGRYMLRDISRTSALRGRVFHMSAVFPQHSVQAARLALAADEMGGIAEYTRAVFEAGFERAEDISLATTLEAAAVRSGLDFARLSKRSQETDIKQRLRDWTERAAAIGIFGAPTFRTPDGENFWGDDRLEQAINWCCQN